MNLEQEKDIESKVHELKSKLYHTLDKIKEREDRNEKELREVRR